MAIGARKALQEQADASVRERWLNLPFTGCDGLPKTGQEFVRRGVLAATVVVPPNTTLALEVLSKAYAQGTQPPEVTLTVPSSLPRIEELASKRAAAKTRELVSR